MTHIDEWWVRDEERHLEPHLRNTHPQYPDGFPRRRGDELLGRWETPLGTVVVADHHHGYEIFFYPCLGCDACSDERYRECGKRGHVLTVAGDKERTVLEYLAAEESPRHVAELAAALEVERAAEEARLAAEREQHKQAMREQEAYAPSLEERLAAAEAELDELRKQMARGA